MDPGERSTARMGKNHLHNLMSRSWPPGANRGTRSVSRSESLYTPPPSLPGASYTPNKDFTRKWRMQTALKSRVDHSERGSRLPTSFQVRRDAILLNRHATRLTRLTHNSEQQSAQAEAERRDQ